MLTKYYAQGVGMNQAAWTSAVSYAYDGSGVSCSAGATYQSTHLSVAVATGTGSVQFQHAYCYDAVGHLQQDIQTTASNPYQFNYQFNAAGGPIAVTYPSGKQVTPAYDGAGRPLNVQAGAQTYASAASYAPQGALNQLTLGNHLLEETCFNTRLQIYGLRVGTASPNSNCT